MVAVQQSLWSDDQLSKPAPDDAFSALRVRALACRKCRLRDGCTGVVFGDGNHVRPDILVLGEGPGENEDKHGKPFVGASGKLLEKMLSAIGYTRDSVYIMNVVNCRPPANRTPANDEIDACRPWMISQIQAVQPRVILTMGSTALKALLGEKEQITKVRGKWKDWNRIPVMSTYHPAYLMRLDQAKLAIEKEKVWGDLQEVANKLKELPKNKEQSNV